MHVVEDIRKAVLRNLQGSTQVGKTLFGATPLGMLKNLAAYDPPLLSTLVDISADLI